MDTGDMSGRDSDVWGDPKTLADVMGEDLPWLAEFRIYAELSGSNHQEHQRY